MDLVGFEILAILLLILLAGYLAAAEVSIASFGANKIEEMKERGDKLAKYFENIQTISNYFFGAIQITTILFLVLASMLTFDLVHRILLFTNWLPDHRKIASLVVASIIVVPLIIVITTLIPKSIGYKYSEQIGRFSVRTFLLITKVYKLPVTLVNSMANWILMPFNEKTNFTQTRFSEDEIRIIISEGVKSGALNETEQEIIENIFEFNDLRANEVMLPRTEMIAIDIEDNIDNIKKIVLEENISHIPVFRESFDNVIGVLNTKTFLRALIEKEEKINLEKIIEPAYFIPESKLISEVLKEMQEKGERIAIIMDEYGGTEGIITIQEIVREIVGEIGEHNDEDEKEYYKIEEGIYLVLGSMFIEDFNNVFNMDLPLSDEYNTVAGFISDMTGKILEEGERAKFSNLNFELTVKERQKMVQFKVWSDSGSFDVATEIKD
ncbi:MAG: hemolysin family protein [Syntrophothermus sp.]